MHDIRTGSGLIHRGLRRALDGDRRWGSIDIRPDRFGVTRYRLVVFPPGITDAERRRVRVARGWPLWGALVWVFCEILLNQMTGPWTALVASTAIYLGLGLVATAMAGEPRRQVRTIGATVMAGHHDPVSLAHRHKLENLAGALMEADELLARGEICGDDPRDDMVAGVRPDGSRLPRRARIRHRRVVAELFQVLSLMAVPAVILLTVRYLIVRQNRLAGAPTNAAPDRRRRSGCATPTHRRRRRSAL